MLLQPASVKTDVSDFWRPRLTVVLDAPPLRAGLHRFVLRTAQPAYAALRLILDDRPAAPMTVFLDREGECEYAKSFSVPRPVRRLELELEPHLDAEVIVAAGLQPLGWARMLAGRRKSLHQLASPRILALKVRQVLSGRSGLAFSAAARPRSQAIYEAWQIAFEGAAEQRRIITQLRRLDHGRPFRLLMVVLGEGAETAARHVAAEPNVHGDVAIVPLIVAPPGSVSQSLRDWALARGGSVCERASGPVPLGLVLDAAEQAGVSAFTVLDRPGRWSALAPAMLAIEMLQYPDCLAVYGDSDRMDACARRTEPRFKPDWSPRWQRATDYVGAAVAFRAGPALRALAARDASTAATSCGLLNRLADMDSAVRHVPRIFFHAATVDDPQPRPSPTPSIHAVPAPSRPSVSVIMPSRDNPHLLQAAIRAVLDEPLPELELILVDNSSSDRKQLALLDKQRLDPRVRVIVDPRPFNFSALVNRGCTAARGEVLLLLNDDVHAAAPGWLATLADIAAEAPTGCVGAVLLHPDGRIQHAGIVLGTFGLAGHAFRNLRPDALAAAVRLAAVHEVTAVTAACLAVRRTVFEEVGGFDEALPVTLNDVDFCLRVRARGYANVMAPHVRLVHHESASRGLDVTPPQVARLAHETAVFLSKWGMQALSDPFYSPHLTLGREDYGPRDI